MTDTLSPGEQPAQQVSGALAAGIFDHGLQCRQPFLGFDRIEIREGEVWRNDERISDVGGLGSIVRRALVPAIAGEYERLLNRQRGVAVALVTSAAPLSPQETEAIAARAASLAGATISLQTAVDPALIGGVTVRIGDRLIDASVRGRLERLRERIVAGAR